MPHKSSEYADLDAAILAGIASGEVTRASAMSARYSALVTPFCAKAKEDYRVIDRRLQALRKAGTIQPARNGRSVSWRLMHLPTPTHAHLGTSAA